MKTVKQRITAEIEYLTALAAMYGRDGDTPAERAAVDAIRALARLLDEIEPPPHTTNDELPVAA
ncbi:MAG TPA: hypothetical protein VJQ56_09010 [Blastocatellia bacterium]|nr:hypothetical protein [Blastocatellia bacterium]